MPRSYNVIALKTFPKLYNNRTVSRSTAVQEAGTVMILSTLSTTSIEDVRKAAPSAILWYQLYLFQDRDLSTRLVKRAEQAGYSALVLTVDSPVSGQRVSNVKKRFSLPSHLKYGNCYRVLIELL